MEAIIFLLLIECWNGFMLQQLEGGTDRGALLVSLSMFLSILLGLLAEVSSKDGQAKEKRKKAAS